MCLKGTLNTIKFRWKLHIIKITSLKLYCLIILVTGCEYFSNVFLPFRTLKLSNCTFLASRMKLLISSNLKSRLLLVTYVARSVLLQDTHDIKG